MGTNFFELFTITPLTGKSFSDPQVIKDLQWVLDQAASSIKTISFQFRKSIADLQLLLFSACWTLIQGHDDLDIRAVTPSMLKVLLNNVVPMSIYFLYLDAAKIDQQAKVWNADAFHVKKEGKDSFQKEIDKSGMFGGWYMTKKIPPRPTVMPTDPTLVKIIGAGEKTAKARLAAENPYIWITISSGPAVDEFFRHAVNDYISKMDSGDWESFLVKTSFIPLTM
jgi:hypothetical protein